MSTNLNLTLNITGNGTLAGPSDITTPSSVITIGNNWPTMKTTLTYGTAANQAKNWYLKKRTLAAGANDDLDLSGGLTNEVGDTGIIFLAIKVLLIAILSPDGVKKLKVGPGAGAGGTLVANAFIGPWASAASSFVQIDNFGLPINHPWGGYAVTSGTADILRINNPGAGSVDYNLLIVGTV